ncbi:hypothetical protein [Thiofaba sp. EF100]|uniref:hypothetical protein n=1 Tax=Thiofaba sp. EF100 TaxID=3121274 RepID=UPI003221C6A4
MMVKAQARALTPIPARFLFFIAMIVPNTATIAANGTKTMPKKRIPRTARAQAMIPATIPVPCLAETACDVVIFCDSLRRWLNYLVVMGGQDEETLHEM